MAEERAPQRRRRVGTDQSSLEGVWVGSRPSRGKEGEERGGVSSRQQLRGASSSTWEGGRNKCTAGSLRRLCSSPAKPWARPHSARKAPASGTLCRKAGAEETSACQHCASEAGNGISTGSVGDRQAGSTSPSRDEEAAMMF